MWAEGRICFNAELVENAVTTRLCIVFYSQPFSFLGLVNIFTKVCWLIGYKYSNSVQYLEFDFRWTQKQISYPTEPIIPVE